MESEEEFYCTPVLEALAYSKQEGWDRDTGLCPLGLGPGWPGGRGLQSFHLICLLSVS